MKKSELSAFITREDKMIVAVKYEVTESYINMILRGDREITERARQMIIDLELLAMQNLVLGIYKCEEMGVEADMVYENAMC